MNRNLLQRVSLVFCFLAGTAAYAQSASEVAVINITEAIQRTKEGQQLARQIENKYKPTQQALQQKQSEIANLREQLNKGANTLSDDAKRNLIRQIQMKEKQYQRDTEDAQAAFNQELQEFQQTIGSKIMTVIDKYAKERGYNVVLDISSPQSPVLYATNQVHITQDIISLYDQEHPVSGNTSSASPSSASASPAAKPAR